MGQTHTHTQTVAYLEFKLNETLYILHGDATGDICMVIYTVPKTEFGPNWSN